MRSLHSKSSTESSILLSSTAPTSPTLSSQAYGDAVLSSPPLGAEMEGGVIVVRGAGTQEGLLMGSSFNLASAAIGLGILSLPYTVHNSGLAVGVTLFVVMGLVTIYSLDVLVSSAELCGRYSYQDTVKEAFGVPISMVVGGVIIWHSSGSTISSFMIVSDLMTPVFTSGVLHNRIFLMFLALIVLFPLCYLRKINSLRHASGGAIIAFLYMAALVVISYFAMDKPSPKPDIQLVGHGVNAVRSIPIIVYAYTCHTQAIPVYAELKDRTSRFMLKVIFMGIFLAFGLYTSVGVFGYLSFGGSITDNILLNYNHEDHEVLVGRIMICAAIILGYPMSSWVMRDSFEQIFFYFKERRNNYHKLDLEDPESSVVHRTVSWRQNLLETSVILGVSIMFAIAIPKINTVFGLVGSTSSVTLNFIVPGLMYIKLLRKFPPKESYEVTKYKKIGAMILVVFGIIIGIVGTTTTIMNLVS